VWKKSGGLSREHRDRYNTQLATDYQVVSVVVSKPAEGSSPECQTSLLARMNSAADTFVFALITHQSVVVGKVVSGTASTWASQSVTVKAGDQFTFVVGTSANDRDVIVKQNGVTRITHTDTTSSALGSGYRYVGLSSLARGTGTVQLAPAEVDVWSAADRLASTT
jgi:hypothetical protein